MAQTHRCVAGLVLLALTLASCARASDESAPPSQPTTTVVTAQPSAASSCALLDGQQVQRITGLPVYRTTSPDPKICMFDLTKESIPGTEPENISLFWMTGNGLCPSCTPEPGLGDQAGWSESTRQLDVVLDDHLLVVYVHLNDEHLHTSTRRQVAIQVYRATEPQLH